MDAIDGIGRAPVGSSNLHAVGYDPARRILAVEFKDGNVFHYREVEVGLAERFLEASSLGGFYSRHIKGRYRAERMTGPCEKCGILGVVDTTCTDCGCGVHRKLETRYKEGAPA